MGHPLFWKLCTILIQGKLAEKKKFKKKKINRKINKYVVSISSKTKRKFRLYVEKTKKKKGEKKDEH